MGQIRLREETVTPDAPTEGVVLFPTVATPSILKLRDDAGNVYTLALLDKAQTFTALQTFAPASTAIDGINIAMPASTVAYAFQLKYNNVLRMYTNLASNNNTFGIVGSDLGANVSGPHISIGRNNNASPAAAFLYMDNKSGTSYSIWPDASGNLRIGAIVVDGTTDTGGTVVGTQTSSRAFKNILGAATNPAQALKNIVEAGRRALRRFTYKSGAYDNQEFEGIIVEEAPRYGMDRDPEHPAGKSLNEVTLLSDLVGAVVALTERLEALESKQNG